MYANTCPERLYGVLAGGDLREGVSGACELVHSRANNTVETEENSIIQKIRVGCYQNNTKLEKKITE